MVIEIVLAVLAWKRGWKAKVLAHVFGGIVMRVICGVVCGLNGGGVEQALVAALFIDVICIVILTVMAVRGRKPVADKNVLIEQSDAGPGAR